MSDRTKIEWTGATCRLLDGREWNEFPKEAAFVATGTCMRTIADEMFNGFADR